MPSNQILDRGREKITRAIWKFAVVTLSVIIPIALLVPANDDLVTLAFYTPIVLIVTAIHFCFGKGRVRLAGYLLTAVFFLVSTGAVIVLGGVRANASASFIVCIMIAAATIGMRAAFFWTLLTTTTVLTIGGLEHLGMLPPPLAPSDSLVNALMATLMPITFAVYLVQKMLELRHEALASATERERERDQAESDLVQAQKMDLIGRLSSGIAHDFNNLLTVIRSSVDVLRLEGNEDILLDDIEQSARRATMLTQRLLTFARPAEMAPKPVDIGQLLSGLVPLLKALTGDEIRLHVDDATEVMIVIDPLAFEQILLNLVINGREAQNGRGQIFVEVEVEDEDEHIYMSVRDDGPGIPAELRDQIFEPFFTTKKSGTGLGLSTIARLVDDSDGKIELVESSGAHFRIRWPRLIGDEHSARSERPKTLELKGLPSVLVVDDNEIVRRAMATILSARGCDVREALDGLEALVHLENGLPDILVTDNAMPGMTGEELARIVTEAHPDLPILIVSGNPLDQMLDGKVAFLAKPFGEEAFIDAIAALT